MDVRTKVSISATSFNTHVDSMKTIVASWPEWKVSALAEYQQQIGVVVRQQSNPTSNPSASQNSAEQRVANS